MPAFIFMGGLLLTGAQLWSGLSKSAETSKLNTEQKELAMTKFGWDKEKFAKELGLSKEALELEGGKLAFAKEKFGEELALKKEELGYRIKSDKADRAIKLLDQSGLREKVLGMWSKFGYNFNLAGGT